MSKTENIKVLLGPSTFAAIDRAPLDKLVQQGYEVIENPFKRKLTKSEVLELLSDDVIGLIAGLEPLDREVMEKTNLKVISRCGSGMSNVDMEAAEELNIKVFSTPFGPTAAVVELTLGILLSMLRMIPQMDRDLHNGKWNKKIGQQLSGKTVAIIGFGRIGQAVAKALQPFSVHILPVDPLLSENDTAFTPVALPDALREADIITLHASGDSRILGKEELKIAKDGVFILNAARGNLIDHSALLENLENEKIAGAWIDTYPEEPYHGPLTNFPQVILTPHIGSYTKECRSSMEMESVVNLIEGLKTMPFSR